MDDEKRRLRDEVAELSKAVRGLREELAASRKHHDCHCGHGYWPKWHWGPVYCGTTSVSTPENTYISTTGTGFVTTNAVGSSDAVYAMPANNTCAATTTSSAKPFLGGLLQ